MLTMLLALCVGNAKAQEWLDLPTSSLGDTRYQLKASSMFLIHDDSPQRALHYGVEIRLLSRNDSVKKNQKVAFKESDCYKSSGVLYVQSDDKSVSMQSFNKSENEPYGKVVQVVCNVMKKLLR